MQVLDTQILSFSRNWLQYDAGSLRDIIINFIGFIPLGLVFLATFVKAGSVFRQNAVLIAVGLCFTVSLTIEILQAWIPSRSSDFLDLILNTLGGFLGAMIYKHLMAYGVPHTAQGKRSKAKGKRIKRF
jgi:glycopeptide antibiotics resistance protein